MVLSGGLGSRMGGNKHLARVGGKRLAEHAIDAAKSVGLDTYLVAKPKTPTMAINCEVIREPLLPRHPLLGILVALEEIGEPIVVCPCDTPLVPGPLMAYLASLPNKCAVLRVEGEVHPLIGRWAPGVESELRAAVHGEHGAVETVMRLGGRFVEEGELREFGDPRRIVRNLNTGSELMAMDDELRRRKQDEGGLFG